MLAGLVAAIILAVVILSLGLVVRPRVAVPLVNDGTIVELLPEGQGGAIQGQQAPSAIEFAGRTYFAFSRLDNGDAVIGMLDHSSGTVMTTVLHPAFEADGHDTPTILVRAGDGRIVVVYCRHSDKTAMYARISLRPGDIGAFGPEVNLHAQIGATDYTYPSIVQLEDEPGAPIYLFFREDNTVGTPGRQATMSYSVSLDGGASWSRRTRVHAPEHDRPYWIVRSNGRDRIDIFTSRGDRAYNEAVPGAHFYLSRGRFHRTDGTVIDRPLPLAYEDFTPVADGTCSVDPSDLVLASVTGHPVVAWNCYLEPVGPHGPREVWTASWDGAAWTASRVAEQASWIVLDRGDPSVVYVETLGSGVKGLDRYGRSPGGWIGTPITASAPYLGHPVPVEGWVAGPRVVWPQGEGTVLGLRAAFR